jgi:hypothetical protein
MTAWTEILGNRTIGGEEPLGVPCGLKPLHAPFPLAGRLVGVLGTVVEIAMLAVFHPRQHLPLRRAIALELVCDEHTGDKQEFLNIAIAETKTVTQPDAMTVDLGRETVVLVAVG